MAMMTNIAKSCLICMMLVFMITTHSPSQASGREKIKVVTTLNLLADFTKNIGGNRVEVKSLLTGLESEHTYTPKPTDIVAIKEAQMLVKVGLGLEVWVESLIKNASNRDLLIVNTSKGIPLIMDGGHEHYHGEEGNPHIWLDPERAKMMIRHITEGLIKIDPGGRDFYVSNMEHYFKDLDSIIREIETLLSPVENRKIITHHPAWPYFAKRFGLEIVDNVQYQIGTEPSARHIADIIRKIRSEKIKVIISEPQLNQKIPEIIARETDIKIVSLTPIPGGIPGTDTYLKMLEYTGRKLALALK